MPQAQGMAEFVERFHRQAFEKTLPVFRQSVKGVAEAVGGDQRCIAAQLRLPEDERQDRDKEIESRHPQHRVFRNPRERGQQQGRLILHAMRVERSRGVHYFFPHPAAYLERTGQPQGAIVKPLQGRRSAAV